jgi:hypothetical protein
VFVILTALHQPQHRTLNDTEDAAFHLLRRVLRIPQRRLSTFGYASDPVGVQIKVYGLTAQEAATATLLLNLTPLASKAA